jgi:DNA (cytosine-5)-methyltransferase 1
MITVGSLCTGIGLIDLGLEWAGLGPVLWQVEILPERRAVLEHWWPGVARYDDVRTVTGLPYVDCIAFGSPCKNLSSAGDRSGLDGPQSRLVSESSRKSGRR